MATHIASKVSGSYRFFRNVWKDRSGTVFSDTRPALSLSEARTRADEYEKMAAKMKFNVHHQHITEEDDKGFVYRTLPRQDPA